MKHDYRTAKGWLRPEEREFLAHIAGIAPKNALILNIGTEYGASLVCLRTGNRFAEIIGLDLDNSQAPQDLNVAYITGDSAEYAEQAMTWLGREIDVLFVDGDHTYDGVVADTVYTSYIGIGGYAIFHDCYDYARPRLNGELHVHEVVPGVNAAVDDWHENIVLFGNPIKGCWQEQGPVGTMRIFKRLSCG